MTEYDVVTVACQACHSGWYGSETDRCPRCKGKVVVTDRYKAIPVDLLHDCNGICVAFGCQGPCGVTA